MKNKALFLLVSSVLSLTLAYGIIFVCDGGTIRWLTNEDGVVETSGALCLLIASVIVFVRFCKYRTNSHLPLFRTRRNVFFLLLAIVFFFGFGEEVSWGQRFFHLSTPEVLKEINVQHELNIHNIKVGSGVWSLFISVAFLSNLFWFSYCLLIPLFSRFNVTFSSWVKKIDLPMVPMWIGILMVVNYSISKLFTLDTFSGSFGSLTHAIVEIKECNLEFLWLMATICLTLG